MFENSLGFAELDFDARICTDAFEPRSRIVGLEQLRCQCAQPRGTRHGPLVARAQKCKGCPETTRKHLMRLNRFTVRCGPSASLLTIHHFYLTISILFVWSFQISNTAGGAFVSYLPLLYEICSRNFPRSSAHKK